MKRRIKQIGGTLVTSILLFCFVGMVGEALKWGWHMMYANFITNGISGMVAAVIFYAVCVWVAWRWLR